MCIVDLVHSKSITTAPKCYLQRSKWLHNTLYMLPKRYKLLLNRSNLLQKRSKLLQNGSNVVQKLSNYQKLSTMSSAHHHLTSPIVQPAEPITARNTPLVCELRTTLPACDSDTRRVSESQAGTYFSIPYHKKRTSSIKSHLYMSKFSLLDRLYGICKLIFWTKLISI